MTRFSSILVANRGEIALRILRTARRLGYRVVSVYSDADRDALHVRLADHAVRIGPPPARDSYLRIDALLAAAHDSGAGAVHPGYGFLAENPDFAQAVADAGLVWIGPPAGAIRAMGDKARAKQLMRQAGVACIPGYDGAAQDDATLHSEAHAIGYPLMVKAAAGGGGRGMRLVNDSHGLGAALAGARSEALAAFGNDQLLLERAITQPRHVEIQVFADAAGNTVHLGERDCSVQRRHQKLIEEAPSPALAGEPGRQLRRRMGEMAVAAARAVNYRGAGTVECLLDTQGSFYFMEMNTRLQVEHPVTEALTGYDLVEWQLRVAQGEDLPETSQDEILRRFESGGHAVEARLCVEDTAQDFVPQSGVLLDWEPGQVRVEHALEPGISVSPFYDSMVAKLIAHAADRPSACASLAAALRATRFLGLQSNQAFLAACLEHPAFADGGASTGFIGSHGADILASLPPLRRPLAALALYAARAHELGHDPRGVALALPWPLPMRLVVDGVAGDAQLQAMGGSRYRVDCGGGWEQLDLIACASHTVTIADAQGRHSLALRLHEDTLFVSTQGRQTVVHDRTLHPAAAANAETAGRVRAPMAGRIAAVLVEVGQHVVRGTPLAVLEAMKMEHPALAPANAVVLRVCAEPGAQVAAGEVLVELVAPPAATE